MKVMTASEAAMTTALPILTVVQAAGIPVRAAGVARATAALHSFPIPRALAALAAGKGHLPEAEHRYSFASPTGSGKRVRRGQATANIAIEAMETGAQAHRVKPAAGRPPGIARAATTVAKEIMTNKG